MAGIPITVIRTYDSRDKRKGDFGIGWNLDIKNIRLEKTSNLGMHWLETLDQEGQTFRYRLVSSKAKFVTITFPDGKVFKFKAKPNPDSQIAAITTLNNSTTISGMLFVAEPGTQGALTSIEPQDLRVEGEIPQVPPGAGQVQIVNNIGDHPGQPYNPSRFKLTTLEGTEFIIDEFAGLISLKDLNDNTLTINNNGIVHSSGKSITFTRDSQGRVQQLTDPNNNITTYSYNAAGDLVSVTDAENNVTSFSYNTNHYLLDITDPRGIKPIRNDYDNSGRLIKHTDSFGNVINYTHQIGQRLETVTDRLGNPTIFEYDGNGNVVKKTDALGNITTYTYDDRDNQLTETNALGKTTTATYDTVDNKLTQADALGNTITYTYNGRRQVLTIIDARGGQTTNTYDAKGHLTNIKDALNNNTTFTYTPVGGLVASVTDAQGNTTTYQYSTSGQPSQITDALGHITTLSYDQNGNRLTESLTKTVNGSPQLITTTNTYDKLNHLTKITYPDSSFTSTNYNVIGKVATATDQLGRTTTYSYDNQGQLLSTTYPDGSTASATYDAEGRKITSIDQLGQITHFLYDQLSRLKKITAADNSFTTTTYDSIGRVSSITDQLGHTTSYEYDPNCGCSSRRSKITDTLGNITTFTYDQNGNLTSFTDARSNTTQFTYDALNRQTTLTYSDSTTQQTAYDSLGHRTFFTDQDGKTSQFFYDSLGRLTKAKDPINQETQYTYDELGKLLTRIDARGNTTSYQHDKLNRQTRITFPDNTFISNTYDLIGHRTAITDQDGKTTQFQYDSLDRLTKVIDPLNKETQYTYDPLGQQLTQTDALGRTTSYEYDQLGRRTKRTLPIGQVEIYSYDQAGRLISRKDFNNKITTYAYDALNRLVSKTPDPSFNQAPITFTYTALGQLLTMMDQSGTTTYSYNNRNRLTSKATPQGTLSYTYNSIGNIATVRSSNTNGVSLDYAYDTLHQLQTVKDNNLATGQNLTTHSYNQVGNLVNITLPNQVTNSYQYDTLNRLTNVASSKDTTSISSYSYLLGNSGNRLRVSELSGRVVNYTYDSIYHLTNETITGSANPNQNGSVSYTYDQVGNRTSRTSTLAAILSQQNITVDNNDRLTSNTYDNNGNTVTVEGKTYNYDFENRIIGIVSNGIDISIKYDGDGNRVEKSITQNGQTFTTKYLVDTNNLTGYAQVVEEIQNNIVNRQYTYGLDLISQRQIIANDWVTHFYGKDGQDSSRYLTDVNGAVTDTYDYDAFGILINQTGSTSNNYLYAGEQFDPDLGLYYNRARYLSVEGGRFWTQDIYEGNQKQPISLHKYLYGNDDPINTVDPSGNAGIIVKLAITVSLALTIATLPILIAGRAQAPTLDTAADYAANLTFDSIDQEAEMYSAFALALNVGAIGQIAAEEAATRVGVVGAQVASEEEAASQIGNFSPKDPAKKLFGTPGAEPGPFNKSFGDQNCLACLTAVIKQKIDKIRYTAEDIRRIYKPTSSIETQQQAVEYVESATGVKLDKIYPDKASLRQPGHYVILFGGDVNGHAIYRYVSPSGRIVLYDPQINTVIKNFGTYQGYVPGGISIYRVRVPIKRTPLGILDE